MTTRSRADATGRFDRRGRADNSDGQGAIASARMRRSTLPPLPPATRHRSAAAMPGEEYQPSPPCATAGTFTVEQRSGYRTAGRSSGVFVCQVRGGWVNGVDLPSNLASL